MDMHNLSQRALRTILEAASHNVSLGFLIHKDLQLDPTTVFLSEEALDYFQYVNFMGLGICAEV
jgi:hypothetical protein